MAIDNPDGFQNVVFTGDGTDQTYTIPAGIFSLIIRVTGTDLTIDDENGIAYIIPAGQAESINVRSFTNVPLVLNQAASDKTYIRELYGKGF